MDNRTTRNWNRRTLLAASVAGTALAARGSAAASVGQVSRATQLPRGNYRIDLHAHLLPPDYRASLLAHGRITVGGYPTPEWSPESAIEFMDRYGIQAQVLSVSAPGVGYLAGRDAIDMARYCNTYAAGLMKTYPTRFGAFAVLPMPDIMASIAELTYALDTLHLDGVILLSAYDGVYLGNPRFEPVMAALNARGAYVFVHPGEIPDSAKPALGLPDFLEEFTFDTTRAATMMIATGTMNRYPGIRFQLAHAGGTVPFLSHRLGVAAQTAIGKHLPANFPRVSLLDTERQIGSFRYDTALSAAPAAMNSVLAVSRKENIVFGTDWPFSALTLAESGDPAPRLSETFTADERIEIERLNPLRELPRLAAAIGR